MKVPGCFRYLLSFSSYNTKPEFCKPDQMFRSLCNCFSCLLQGLATSLYLSNIFSSTCIFIITCRKPGNFLRFMEVKFSLTFSRNLTNGSYTDPVDSNLKSFPLMPILIISLNDLLLQVFCSLQGSDQTFIYSHIPI